MGDSTEVKSGYLSVHQKAFLGGNNWPKKWCILLRGKHKCLQTHDSEKNISNNPKQFDLDKISAVEKLKNKEHGFEVVVNKDRHLFRSSTGNRNDETSWIDAFNSLINMTLGAERCSTVSGDLIVDENLLYESLDAPPTFRVQILENTDSHRCLLSSVTDYLLAVHINNIALVDAQTKSNIYQWPFQHIRKFGRSEGLFQIYSGRRCPSGAGLFEFYTLEGNEISACISKNTKTIRNEGSDETSRQGTPPIQTRQSPKIGRVERSQLPPALSPPLRTISHDRIPNIPKTTDTVPQIPDARLSRPLSKSISAGQPSTIIDQSFKNNLGKILTDQTSNTVEGKLEATESHSVDDKTPQPQSNKSEKGLKKEREKERKEREKREKEKQKEDEKREKDEHKKREKEDAKRKEKEKKEKVKKKPLENVAPAAIEESLYDDPSGYEEMENATQPLKDGSKHSFSNDNNPKKPQTTSPLYSEPDMKSTKVMKQTETYSDAADARTNAWREFGQEKDNVHVDDYANIKEVAKFNESDYDLPGAISPHLQQEDDDDTYDHFQLKKSQIKQKEDTQNIYGISSGKTIEPLVTKNISQSDGYEPSSTVTVKILPKVEKLILGTDEISEFEI